MALKCKGKFIIVDVEKAQTSYGGITLVDDNTNFAKGKVVSSGPFVILDDGSEVIISLENVKALGLGYPETYIVVDGDSNLVAVLT